jgi:hypothetical protein
MTLVLEIALGIILALVVLRMISAFVVLLITSEIAQAVVGVPFVIGLIWLASLYHPYADQPPAPLVSGQSPWVDVGFAFVVPGYLALSLIAWGFNAARTPYFAGRALRQLRWRAQ